MDPTDFAAPGPGSEESERRGFRTTETKPESKIVTDESCVMTYLGELLKYYRKKWGRPGFVPTH